MLVIVVFIFLRFYVVILKIIKVFFDYFLGVWGSLFNRIKIFGYRWRF